MRIVVVSGIFPPDLGGPATHVLDVSGELRRRGHQVRVLTLGERGSATHATAAVRYSRRWPWPARLGAVTTWLVRRRREYDVVYAVGLHPAAVLGARLAGRPVVVRVVADPVWERASRLRLTAATFEEFQRAPSSNGRIAAMRAARDWSVRRATTVTTHSEFLATFVRRWARGRAPVTVVPNGVESTDAPRQTRQGGLNELDVVTVSRLVPVKRVDVLLEAIALTEGVNLEIVGDGPERTRLERRAEALGLDGRVRFAGAVPHEEALRRIAAADVVALASEHEGFPHVVGEALASGTPVVAARAGAIPEMLRNGVDGFVVDPATPESFAGRLAELRADAGLLRWLSSAAREAGAGWSVRACADRVESALAEAVRERPRAVFVGRSRNGSRALVRARATVLAKHVSPTIIMSGRLGIDRLGQARVITLPDIRPRLLGAGLFYALGPALAVILTAGRRGMAIVCQSPFEAVGAIGLGRLLPRRLRPLVVVELHGDWQAAAQLYGSRARRALARPADHAARWALRRADRVRAVSVYLEEVARRVGFIGPLDRFATFSEIDGLTAAPTSEPPDRPWVVFVGSLEHCKGVDVLIDSWAEVARRVPVARLLIAGDGPLRETLRRRVGSLGLRDSVRFVGVVDREELMTLLDSSALLVLPSRSEGLGRVVLESFARARPVVATRVGGLPETVEEGRTGWLVDPGDARGLAQTILGALEDPARLRAMGAAAREVLLRRDPAAEFEAGIARLARWIDGAS